MMSRNWGRMDIKSGATVAFTGHRGVRVRMGECKNASQNMIWGLGLIPVWKDFHIG